MRPLLSLVSGAWGRRIVIGLPFLWLALFFLLPFLVTLKIAFSPSINGIPPIGPILGLTDDGALRITLHIENWSYLFQDPSYVIAYGRSLLTAAITTVLCLVIGYPMAYRIARASPRMRPLLLILVIMPFWTSFLIRVYAWIGILKDNGLINNFLLWTRIIHQPLQMMNTQFAVHLVMTYAYLPFMLLPLYTTLEKLDLSLLEAASDLGGRPIISFLTVTLPLSLPGIVAGSLLVFIPAVGEFIIPTLVGSPGHQMIASVVFDEFFSNRDWPTASAVATAVVLLLLVPILALVWLRQRNDAKLIASS
ncbi:ABC transporter permease [Acidisoma silvae]|uniref:ABC transporter permease subunit n=1 Tax=Acidisoma silvae TaxID=2802396 RepID=A0A964DY10_9PROT|nr:ABC transporter permease subunit [Acidisoma silvae]MCB8874607.1 ABC transporter permease subunit [Acidisoma silvae]